jgi:hypothetical protein
VNSVSLLALWTANAEKDAPSAPGIFRLSVDRLRPKRFYGFKSVGLSRNCHSLRSRATHFEFMKSAFAAQGICCAWGEITADPSHRENPNFEFDRASLRREG